MNRNYKEFTFQVLDDVHFRSPENLVQSLNELEAGMMVFVGVDDLGGGSYIADLIIVRK